jgi:6-phosphogluconolactonase
LKIEVLPDAAQVALRAARFLSAAARAAVSARGRFALAVSGGGTPGPMLRALADEDVPWHAVHLFQVDERVAPDGDADRNLVHLHDNLVARVPLPPENLHAMPVEAEDLDAAAALYAHALVAATGSPVTLDVVQLGVGADGHTASLVPGDPVVEEVERDVAVTALYRGRRRMTLTFPVLDRARAVLWVVTGPEKAAIVARLVAGDRSIAAGRVRGDRAVLLADAGAGSRLATAT